MGPNHTHYIVLRLAFALNNTGIIFTHKILIKGLDTRLTRISALMSLTILEVVFPPTSTSSFSTAVWCHTVCTANP